MDNLNINRTTGKITEFIYNIDEDVITITSPQDNAFITISHGCLQHFVDELYQLNKILNDRGDNK